MADADHLARLQEGVEAWNAWRRANPSILPDLFGADLHKANLAGADLRGANLIKADLREADLRKARLQRADLREADLQGADLYGTDLSRADLYQANLIGAANLGEADFHSANLSEADLTRADLTGANLQAANLTTTVLIAADLREANLGWTSLLGADLMGANLTGADLRGADLSQAKLSGAILSRASLYKADLYNADLSGANLREADLAEARLVETDLRGADFIGCGVYGVSAWGLKLEKTKQQNLIITPNGEAEITVDNIEVAQFIYLLLHNPKIRDVIDTITSKAVLILGRFTPERKKVLDDVREELRKHNYVPILFDFEKPTSQNLTATIMTLARLARFIIADLTDPSSIPYELGRIVPTIKVPVQPILLSSRREFAMFPDLQDDFHWVLPIHYYGSLEQLIIDLAQRVIGPAECKVLELRGGTKDVS